MARIDAHRVSLLILELTVGCTEGHRLLLSLLMIGLNSVVLWLLGVFLFEKLLPWILIFLSMKMVSFGPRGL